MTPAPVELTRGSPGWPVRFEHLSDPPVSIWLCGALPAADTPCVAVVGSRRASPGALLTAHDIGRDLAAAGVVVVSGMARGIDAAAHRGALDGGGETIAVLGCGVDVCYPAEHRDLRDRIVARGCVVSEYPAGAPPLPGLFPRRNRLIAALAEAVVVVEATARSGALSTAARARDLGREVLAVPGSIRSATSVGTNLLIRDGARPYLEPADLFEEVPALRRGLVAPPRATEGGAGTAAPEADPVLRMVLDRLGADPVHPDDIGAALGLSADALGTALTTLELRGAITEVCGGRVARTF